MLRYIPVAFLFLSILGCTDEKDIDCSLVLCAAGDSINLELIADGANVISNGTYTPENINVTGTGSEELKIQVYPDTRGGTTGLLEISSFDWTAGSYTYTVILGNEWEFEFTVDFSTAIYPCCGERLEIQNLTSETVAVDFSPNSGYYTIILN